MGDVVSANYMTYERGRKMRRDGLPCPPKPPEEGDGLDTESLLWTGYRVEMAMDFMRRKKIAEMLDMPVPEWRE